MKIFFLVFLSSVAFADSENLFTAVKIEVRLGDKFRDEVVSDWTGCIERRRASRVYLINSKNELREIGLWDKEGRIHSGGMKNLVIRREVDAIFARSKTGPNPCLKTDVPVVPVEKVEEKIKEIPIEEDKPQFPPGYLQ